jgi:alpha 1,3-mannosyltransferase
MAVRSPRCLRLTFSAYLIAAFISIVLLSKIFPGTWPAVSIHGIHAEFDHRQLIENTDKFPSGARFDIALAPQTAEFFTSYPLKAPYKDLFGELGRRAQILKRWIQLTMDISDVDKKRRLAQAVETAAVALFPFLANANGEHRSETPFTDLHSRIVKGSMGIVIPAGGKTRRFSCHLIGLLREVVHTRLPIQIVYAGDGDLSPKDRREMTERFDGIEFLDVTTAFDDTVLQLADGGWAIKPFAVLASQFEQVILLDADTVLLQAPEALFQQQGYIDTGVLLFHDRLLWQHAYQSRHEWWRAQILNPSQAMEHSLVWTEDYAEEGDSGVVVVDKSRLNVFVGLLHVAWQNSKDVRDDITYEMVYGDKETWWLGFELTGAAYIFEKHYGAMVGWIQDGQEDDSAYSPEDPRVCSFVIAHVDQNDQLLWYNGGLLKNKLEDATLFEVPTHWMIDGTWEKGATKQDMSCMVGNNARRISTDDKWILERSIELAKQLDIELGLL